MLERIIERVTSNYPIEKLMPLCAAARLDDRPAAINMRAMDWENRPNTFLHCLYKQKRYDSYRGNMMTWYLRGLYVVKRLHR